MTAPAQKARPTPLLVLGSVLALLVAAWVVPDVGAFFIEAYVALTSRDPAVTRAFVEGLGWAGPLALIAGFVLQAALPVLPALVLTAVAAHAYGPVEGFFIVYVGTLLGAAAGYGLGRAVGDALVRRLVGERARQAAHTFAERYGMQGVVMVRLMPVLSADVLNLVAGAAGMGFRPFMLATAAGALPVTVLVVWLSASAQRMVWGLGLLSAAVALVAGVRWWLARRAASRRAAPVDPVDVDPVDNVPEQPNVLEQTPVPEQTPTPEQAAVPAEAPPVSPPARETVR